MIEVVGVLVACCPEDTSPYPPRTPRVRPAPPKDVLPTPPRSDRSLNPPLSRAVSLGRLGRRLRPSQHLEQHQRPKAASSTARGSGTLTGSAMQNRGSWPRPPG